MKNADVLKFEGDNKSLIWKHPIEDFNKNTQLIVHQSQEAIFFLNGEAMDLFGPGRHTLVTEKHCEVYFINKVEQMAIKWGTPEKFYFNEDIAGSEVPFLIAARGEMSLKIRDSRKLLLKVLGTGKVLSQETLVNYFFDLVVSKVKSCIAKTMRKCKMSIFTVDEYLPELSEELKKVIHEEFIEYGVEVVRFVVSAIIKPEGEENYEKYKKIKFERAIDMPVKSDVIYCGKCHEELPSKALFCMYCGTKLIKKCRKCGCELSDEAVFCIKCGERV